MSVEEQYADGKKSGLGWDVSWIPGGPWVMHPDPSHDSPEFVKKCDISLEENRVGRRDSGGSQRVDGFWV